MEEMNTKEKEEACDGKKGLHVNVGLLAGMLFGGILGAVIGKAVHDVPLYTGFGMLIGMALVFDLTAHRKGDSEAAHDKQQNPEERR
ncbi:MAG: hypothetical protein IJ833_08600 [Lachnospiraceae bacterium]|nr:hypothetical protein [Lachnospiraceae bacterium]